MVNNAALIHQARIVDLKEEDWDRIIKTNLRSVFLGSKYAAIQMIKQGKGGRIINISSIHHQYTGLWLNPRQNLIRQQKAG